jgi:hypothetical protein
MTKLPPNNADFIREWMDAYALPYEDFVAARKEIAARYGLTIGAAKTRGNKHRLALMQLGLPAPVAPDVPPGRPFGRREGAAGEGPGGSAVPPCAPPSPAPAPRRQRAAALAKPPKPFVWNNGELRPPLNPLPARDSGISCIPVNRLDPGCCAFLKGEAPKLAYCNAPIPKENRAYMLRRSYCDEHAKLCVMRPKDRRDDAS